MGSRGEREKGGRLSDGHAFFCLVFLFVFFAFFAVSFTAAQDLESIRSDLASGNTELKRNALSQIKNLHSEAASRLALSALSDKDEIVRATAATAVIFLPKPDAARVILPLLADKAEFVRREASFALGEVGDPSSTVAITRMLEKDKSRMVKAAAAAALGKIGDVTAVDALTAVLKRNPNSADIFVRRSSARSVGQIAQMIRTGRRSNITPADFLPEKYKEHSPATEPATNGFPVFRVANDVLKRVVGNAKESDDTRREAAFALGAIGDYSSATALTALLSSPDVYLAEICRESLLKLKKPQ